jgi:hypothetical protein
MIDLLLKLLIDDLTMERMICEWKTEYGSRVVSAVCIERDPAGIIYEKKRSASDLMRVLLARTEGTLHREKSCNCIVKKERVACDSDSYRRAILCLRQCHCHVVVLLVLASVDSSHSVLTCKRQYTFVIISAITPTSARM